MGLDLLRVRFREATELAFASVGVLEDVQATRRAVRDRVHETARSLGLEAFKSSVRESPSLDMWLGVTWGSLIALVLYFDGILIRPVRQWEWTPEQPHAWFCDPRRTA